MRSAIRPIRHAGPAIIPPGYLFEQTKAGKVRLVKDKPMKTKKSRRGGKGC